MKEPLGPHDGIEIVGVDHIYLTVSDLERSQRFWDAVMPRLGFFKGDAPIGGDPHCHYFNRVTQISIRPARSTDRPHDPYAPGLHHVCLQATDRDAVDRTYAALRELGIEVSEPALYAEYAEDYYAIFFEDPDGLRFEVVARRAARRRIAERFDELEGFLNPLRRLDESDSEAAE